MAENRRFRLEGPQPVSSVVAAEKLGISRRSLQRWLSTGMDVWQADEFAWKVLGRHPSEVWPDWLDAVDDDCTDDEQLELFDFVSTLHRAGE